MAHQDPTWTVIPHFTGHQVNSKGEIRNIATGKILQSSVNQTGVRYVSIQNTTIRKYQNMAVSRLVAMTFCPGNSPDTDTVLHLNGNTEDNRADNLMWAQRFHAIQFHQEILDTRQNYKKRVQDEVGRIYRNVIDAAMHTGCLPSAIDYAVRFNDAHKDEHINFKHAVYPGQHIFTSA